MKTHTVMTYLRKDDKILFQIRKKENDTVHRQGMLVSTGGKIEEGEGIEEAAIREVKEESSITVNSLDFKGIMYFRNFGKVLHDTICFLFTSTDFSGEPVTGNEGSFVWKSIAEIHSLNVYSQDKVYLKYMLEHNFFVAEFLCDGYEMTEHKLLKAF